MNERKPDRFLSEMERERFDAMAISYTVKEAAQRLNIAEGTLNNWNYKLRKRLLKERGHLNSCVSQRKRSKLLNNILKHKRSTETEESVEEDLD